MDSVVSSRSTCPVKVVGDVNMLHMELLHHLSHVAFVAQPAFDAIVQHAVESPYLMHQCLAISALHLSTLRPTQQELYSHQASELQTRGLSLFNNLPSSDNSQNPISVFLYSSLLGLHVLFDTLLYRPTDFSLFVDRFVNYLHIHRGTSTVAKGGWTLLQNSEIGSLLPSVHVHNNVPEGNEFFELKTLMQAADLSQASISTCLQAIERLQWVFDRSPDLHKKDVERAEEWSDDGQSDLLFAWPITVSSEYTELLSQRRPEALAVLAHWAVLLHRKRNFWVLNDGGRYLIESISRHLGAYWEHWLALPISVLQEGNPND